jgi:hypothetical protein
MDWKNKYLKYKLKYFELKKTIEINSLSKQFGGTTNKDKNKIFDELIDYNIKKNKWNFKSLLLDCIKQTTMQTETANLIDYIIKNNIIKPSKKHMELALIYAVYKGYYIIVEELIKLCINPNIPNFGQNLIDNSINNHYYKTAKVLLKSGCVGKNFYSQEQMLSNQINFSNDPENIVGLNIQTHPDIYSEVIYEEFKEILLSNSRYNFENLARNNFKSEFLYKLYLLK